MPCENPKIGTLQAYNKIDEKTGEIIPTFRLILKQEYNGKNDIIIPCGKCSFCKNAKKKDWATRLTMESENYKEKFFLTLTYDEKNLPKNGSLQKKDLQDFFKRLRRHIEPTKIKYFAVGEYGEKSLRSHYHAIIYGFFPKDIQPVKNLKGSILFTSPSICKIWGKGQIGISTVNYQTCAYVARYVLKKAYDIDKQFYKLTGLTPEFQVSSKRPAILGQLEPKKLLEILKDEHIILPARKPIIARIPQYLLSKIKKYWRIEYNKFAEKQQTKAKQKIINQLKETDLNFWHNYKKNIQIEKQKQKRALQKSKNIF